MLLIKSIFIYSKLIRTTFFLLLFPVILYSQPGDSIKKPAKWYNCQFTKVVVAPVILSGCGLATLRSTGFLNKVSIQEDIHSSAPNFHTHVDDYLQFVPATGVYILNIAGVQGKDDLLNYTILLAKSELIMAVIIYPLRAITHIVRPDSSAYNSLPSGHTAEAFVAATLLYKEYKDKSIWYGVGAYTMATCVGALRMLNNKHWISDVLVGAGVGILSVNIACATHRYRWGKKNNTVMVIPAIYGNGIGVGLLYCPG